MGISGERIVAVIMVGGPTKGTRFRPLSLNVPKPLFPLAGQPMVHHPISACRRIPNLAQIYLIGFYEEREFALYVSSISHELRIPVRYLREDRPHGSAGGLYNFRDYIMEDSPSHIFLLNCDVCCSFPLPDMLEAHKSYGGMGTILVSQVSAESANQFGALVADPVTKELLHYTEKPETFVSDLINCGVYIFTPEIFTAIEDAFMQRTDRANLRRMNSLEALQSATKAPPADYVRLDQDILSPLAGKKELYTYETLDFWEQIKTPGMSLKCSALYLCQYRHTAPHLLAGGNGTRSATIIGDVYIHPSAKVNASAKIGPNVSISANARIGAGVRLISCIILDDVEIKENAIVINSIVGWKSTIGKWSRVQNQKGVNCCQVYRQELECAVDSNGPSVHFDNPPLDIERHALFYFAKPKGVNCYQVYRQELECTVDSNGPSVHFDNPPLDIERRALFYFAGEEDYNAKLGITILGEAVAVEDEVVVINSIVLPHKTLNVSVQEEIIL